MLLATISLSCLYYITVFLRTHNLRYGVDCYCKCVRYEPILNRPMFIIMTIWITLLSTRAALCWHSKCKANLQNDSSFNIYIYRLKNSRNLREYTKCNKKLYCWHFRRKNKKIFDPGNWPSRKKCTVKLSVISKNLILKPIPVTGKNLRVMRHPVMQK